MKNLRQAKKIKKLISSITAIALCLSFFIPTSPAEAIPDHLFPRIANYYLSWELSESTAKELSKWDVVVLDMEIQLRSPHLLQKMREWNPDIVLLVYITPQEIIRDHHDSFSKMRKNFGSGISSNWYLKGSDGSKLSWWPGTYLLNVTDDAPKVNGVNFQDYLVNVVVGELLSNNYWDGVYYDNMWDSITHFVGDDVDYNLDGQKDSSLDTKWQQGMTSIYQKTRSAAPGKLVIANGTTRSYGGVLNGKMLENFSNYDWTWLMQTYRHNRNTNLSPKVDLVNANTNNGQTSERDYKSVRFTLASTLMENGYYSYDYGDTNHGQTWWYDEYDVDLGTPIADADSPTGASNYARGVWTRQFQNGIAVVNSSNEAKRIELGGEFEKIRGTQDSSVNDGSIVSSVEVGAEDGQLLMKTISTLSGTLFKNGSFVRFFDASGNRVRNGFFVFEDGYEGGNKIAHIDMNNNDKEDLLIATNREVQAWRDDGQPFVKLYPFEASFRGDMELELGDVNSNGNLEILAAPGHGEGALPIKVYTKDSLRVYADWYPFGKDYTGGYSIAVGNVDFDPFEEIIVGMGPGNAPKIAIFDHNLRLQSEFIAYESYFRGGVNVAAGNVLGGNKDAIIVSPGKGGKPYIKVFKGDGSLVSGPFLAYSSFDLPGLDVRASDVNFDGVDDIIGMSDF